MTSPLTAVALVAAAIKQFRRRKILLYHEISTKVQQGH
jgi:hypothetical protein